MNNIPDAPATDAPAQQGRRRSWGEITARVAASLAREDFPRGDLAALRRMDPDAPDAAAFWRLLAQHELAGNPAVESKWALILHGIALMTDTSENRSAHSATTPVGRALYLGGEEHRDGGFFSETRLNRLLTARGPMMRALLARMFRMVGTGRPFDWREMAHLILYDDYREDLAEEARRDIARAYYAAERRSALTNSQ